VQGTARALFVYGHDLMKEGEKIYFKGDKILSD